MIFRRQTAGTVIFDLPVHPLTYSLIQPLKICSQLQSFLATLKALMKSHALTTVLYKLHLISSISRQQNYANCTYQFLKQITFQPICTLVKAALKHENIRLFLAFLIQDVCLFLPQLSSLQSACATLHCHVSPVRLYHIFPHYLINNTIFGKAFESQMCIFIFCTIFS